ncbi:MAG: response regulator [Candidatus Latescibacteria bacterium]|jgi:DNA-binding response OmpR family regulator|nr:response regulator [Bacteroidota bacterium]MBT4482259.1 response regulator [Candidatus Latescibacterota bacterium]
MVLDNNKILIVDDEKALRFGLSRCIKAAGFETLEAADGNEAMCLVSEHGPGLIILDVMMRGMSGLEVCRLLRKDPQVEEIKIIILSAKGQIKEREEGLDAGADYYITKPFDYRELIKTIKQSLESR